MVKTIIFDLDGTLANLNHRLHLVKGHHKDYDKFFAACTDDTPIVPVCELLRMLYNGPIDEYVDRIPKVIIVSGRSETARKETEIWLKEHNIPYDDLIMRPAGDYRSDDIVKEEILDGLLREGHEILFTVDDRQRVVDMWRRRGLICLQAQAWKEDEPLDKLPKGLLTLMVGPSGAGKSSWLEEQHMATDPDIFPNGVFYSHIISSDQLRRELCGNFRDQTKNNQVFHALHEIVKARIDNGLPCVVDATNIKRADRLSVVKLADGSPVRYIVIDRTLPEKLEHAGWRSEVPGLIERHHNTFQTNLKAILKGDNLTNVQVIDLRKPL